MLDRLRQTLVALLLKTPVLIVLGLVLTWLLFGWFGFEPLVKWAAPKYVADKSQHQLSIGAAKFDPLDLSLSIKGLTLKEPDGKPLLAFDELFVDFEAGGLLRRAFAFGDIRLTGPDAHLVLLPDGRLNWTALIEAFKSEDEEEDKDLPRLLIGRIALEKGRVHFTDRKVAAGYQAELNPIDFQLTDLSTLPDDKGAYTLATRTQAGARVRWKGELALNPMLASGELAVDDLRLDRVWPYLRDKLNMKTPEGVAALGLTYRAAYADKQFSLAVNDLGFRLAGLKLRGPDDVEPVVALDSLELAGGRFDLGQQRLDIARIALQGGHVHVQRRGDGSIDLTDWFRPASGAAEQTTSGAAPAAPGPSLVPAARGNMDDLYAIQPGGEVRLGGLAFAYKSTKLHPGSLPRLDKVVQVLKDKPELEVQIGGHTDSVGSDAYNLRMSQARAESVRDYLARQGIGAERIQTRGYGESRPVADNATEAGREANRRVVLRFHLPGQDPEADGAGGGGAPGVWTVNLEAFSLDGLGLRYQDATFAAPLSGEVGNVKVGFKTQAQAGGGAPQVKVEDFGVSLSGIRVNSMAHPKPLLVLGGVALEGGRLDLAGREVGVARVALLNGRIEAERDEQGRIALAEAFRPASPAAAVPPARADDNGGPAWKYRLDSLELSGFEVAARDHTVRPAAALTLAQIEASITGLSQDLAVKLPVKLALRVKEGGRLEAGGSVVPASQRADLKLKLAGLALQPVQPYLAQATNLVLSQGRLSTAGQVRYLAQAPRYQGGFSIDDLLIKEASTGDRLLAWKSVYARSLVATAQGVDMDELRLDRPGMKMVIYQDKSTSISKALRKAPPAAASDAPAAEGEGKTAATAPPTQAPAPAPASVARPDAPPAFVVNIDRVRLEGGEMDFADLSLALPFGTRIHTLKGSINGVSSRPGGQAQLELDGLVDEYGLARAVGQLDMFDPTGFMDIKVVFQNVEMTNLTPYTATFVGRKIDSGKLSLNLEYKLKDRQMLGENQIIMNRLTLGERVESPTAKNLPLDLAIAILEDSNGVIDLELPVSGSLDDPQFSYGRIIWKAIGNIIVKIVTAPFRILGKLFGGGGEEMEQVAFELGDPDLLPPEKEKLKKLATALQKRPRLALSVRGTYAPEVERPVLKEMRLRRQVAEQMGIKLEPGEEPGPVSTAQPKAQAALEALYAKAFGEEALKTLLARFAQANPEKQPEKGAAGKLISRLGGLFKEKPKPLSETELAELKGADLHALIYLRLLAKVEIGDDQLAALGKARGEAIAAAVMGAGVPAERVRVESAEKVEADGREVRVKLSLTTGAKAAPTTPTAIQPAVAQPATAP
ncbi:MAG TPA: DUF748 domain-containing protein [Thiobacillaceae bacterium]|nr:DUF748 domain-containing protein [Thiobacillaceae bacterium]